MVDFENDTRLSVMTPGKEFYLVFEEEKKTFNLFSIISSCFRG